MTDLLQATTHERLVAIFEQIVDDAGGTGFAIAVLPVPGDLTVRVHRGFNGYCEHYLGAHYAPICPVTRTISRSIQPFLWNDVRVDPGDVAGQAVMSAARDFGVVDGFLVPVHMQDSQKGCIFVRVPDEELSDQARQWLTMLSMAFHSRLMQLQLQQDGVEDEAGLSWREREVLRWLAEGKSAEDAADIIGISAATVMFHYRNVALRYGTLNRTHTVVEAVRRGALSLG
ncbi:MAG TPA: LuxR family transcriptional regulator [Steroidobacteraceae bacterium]|jgi:LuxR family quorum sensing-dependent transcriptional regulator